MSINPLPSQTQVWDIFERRWYARRIILNIEWDSAYYSSSFFENDEWTDPKIQYFNFCTIARLRDWCEATEPKVKEYRTTDLWLASTLIYIGKEFTWFNKLTDKKLEFIFKNDIDIDNIIFEYLFKKTIKVEPIKFSSIMKNLKTMMYQDAKVWDSFSK